MADTTNADLFPVLSFYYEVSIDGNEIAFSEVSGLDIDTDPVEYRHGDSELFHKIKGAGMMKYSNITCKKGVFEADTRLHDMFSQLYEGKSYYTDYTDRFDMTIILNDENGKDVTTWSATNCFPIKLSGTSLKSDGNAVAIESIEFAIEQLRYV